MITNTTCQLIKTASNHKFKSPPCKCIFPNLEHFALGTIVQCTHCKFYYKLYRSNSYLKRDDPYSRLVLIPAKTYWRKMFWRNIFLSRI